MERETIYTDEVDMLMSGKDYKEVLEYMERHDSGKPDSPFGRKFENTPAGAAVKDLQAEKGEAEAEKPKEGKEPSKTPDKKDSDGENNGKSEE